MPFLQNSLFLKTQVGNVYANALIGAEAPVSSLPSSDQKTSLWFKGVLVGVAVTESALTAVKQYQRSLFSGTLGKTLCSSASCAWQEEI